MMTCLNRVFCAGIHELVALICLAGVRCVCMSNLGSSFGMSKYRYLYWYV